MLFSKLAASPEEPSWSDKLKKDAQKLVLKLRNLEEPCLMILKLELTPLTGRKHQLRAQMNALGLPIVGDRIYPRLWPALAAAALPDYHQPLQLLARELAFTDPVTGQARCFVSRRTLAWVGRADTVQPSPTPSPPAPTPPP